MIQVVAIFKKYNEEDNNLLVKKLFTISLMFIPVGLPGVKRAGLTQVQLLTEQVTAKGSQQTENPGKCAVNWIFVMCN